MRTALLLALAAAPSAWAGLPVGAEVPQAVVVDITPDGLNTVEGMIPSFVPTSIPIPFTPLIDESTTEVCIPFLGCSTIVWYAYELNLTNGNADLNLNYLDIVPGNGQLELSASLTANVNSAADPMYIDTFAKVAGIDLIDGTCESWLDPTTIDVNASIGLDLVPDPLTGEPSLDVSLGTLSQQSGCNGITVTDCWDWDLDSSKIFIGNCSAANVIDTLNTVLNWFGIDIYDDFIIPPLEALIDDQINSLLADLPQTLEDGVNGAIPIEQDIDLGGASMHLALSPNVLDIQPTGVRLGMGGSFTPNQLAPCMEPYVTDESLSTAGLAPDLAWAPASLPFTHDAGIFVDDDFINQALFGVWYGGVLCQSLSEDDGLPINTLLLDILAPGLYGDYFPDNAPMQIVTRPKRALEAYYDGPHNIDIEVRDLGLDFYADLDYRRSRTFAADLGLDVGVDLDFDGTSGVMGVLVDLPSDSITTNITYNELLPEANSTIEGSFANLFDTIVGPLLDPLLGDLNFGLPAFFGVGLTDLVIAPSGDNGDFLGAFADAGPVDTDVYGQGGGGCAGCGGASGCGDPATSCDPATGGSCSSGRPPSQLLFLVPLLLAALRRRQR